MQRDRRVILLVLVLFLGVSAFLVLRAHDDAVSADEGPGVAGVEDDFASEPGGRGAWRHHDWAVGEPGAAPSRRGDMASVALPEQYDPQAWAMRRSYPMDGDAGLSLPFSPVERVARIVDSEGSLAVGHGATCQVRVLPVRSGGFNCLVRVMCDGHVLYPNPTQTAGYAPCEIENGRAVTALDDGHTAADGDPLVRVDLREGLITVEDRGDGVASFRATLRVSS